MPTFEYTLFGSLNIALELDECQEYLRIYFCSGVLLAKYRHFLHYLAAATKRSYEMRSVLCARAVSTEQFSSFV